MYFGAHASGALLIKHQWTAKARRRRAYRQPAYWGPGPN